MASLAKRLVGVVLALLGLGGAVVGLWFAGHLGSSGTASFTAHPKVVGPVVIDPSILNRVSVPVRVTATPAPGDRAFMGIAVPSDAASAVGVTARQDVTGVMVRGWGVAMARHGSGIPAGLTGADLWREQVTAGAPVTMTVQQANAPETVVASGATKPLAAVTISWSRKTWFFQSLVLALVGLIVLGAGLAMSVRRGRGGAPTAAPAELDPTVSEAGA